MFQAFAEIAKEVATAAEEVNLTEAVVQDIESLMTQINEVEASMSEVSSVEEIKDVVSNVELYSSPEKRLAQAKGSDGEWLGEAGKSEFVPNDAEVRELMKERGVDSIRYDEHCEPDFSPVSEGTVEIDNMTWRRKGPGGNYEQAFEKLAEKWNEIAKDGKTDWNARDVDKWRQDNNLTPHERMDRKTVDFVPTPIHLACKHFGGCIESKLKANIGGKFDV